MALVSDNLALLQQRQPDLAERVARVSVPEWLRVQETPSGYPTLILQREGKALALHHPQEPLAYAQKIIQQTPKLQTAQNLFLADCGLGYLPLLVEQMGYTRTSMVLLQPSLEILRVALEMVDWGPLLKNPVVSILVDEQGGPMRELLMRRLMDFAANPPLLIESPAIRNAYPTWSETLRTQIEETLRFAQSGLLTKFNDGPLTLHNLLTNLEAIDRAPGLAALQENLAGVPTVIVAAGPSLAKNIDQLKGHEQNVLIMATDTAFEPLRQAGVTPHWVITVDPTELNLRHFPLEEYGEETTLLFDPEARPEIVAKFPRRISFLTDKHDFFTWLDRGLGGKGIIKKGGMVSQAALQVAACLGCSPIVLMGQDLALHPDQGHTHLPEAALSRQVQFVSGDRDHAEVPRITGEGNSRERIFWVEGVEGKPVPTIQSFSAYIRLLEDDIRQAGLNVIDCTEGGAKIAGTRIAPLAATLNELPPLQSRVQERIAGIHEYNAQEDSRAPALRKHLQALIEERVAKVKEALAWAEKQPAQRLSESQKRLETLRARLFRDPAAEYLIEYGAPRELFDFLKLPPANASAEAIQEHAHQRCQILLKAVQSAAERLEQCWQAQESSRRPD